MTIDRDKLRRKPIPYLGWYLEGEPGRPGSGTYVWYANEDRGSGSFKVTTDTSRVSGDKAEQYAESMAAGLMITKGKVFLGTWDQEGDHRVELPTERKIPTAQIRRIILNGLYRLYEEGFQENDIEVEMAGVALELGVQETLVERAVGFLYDDESIQDPRTIGLNWRSGHFWLSPKGVSQMEDQTSPTETFLQELYRTTLTRLAVLDTDLSGDFQKLQQSAGTLAGSRQDLVGFAAMVRDFIQELTDRLYAAKVSTVPLAREQTINKVTALTQTAASDTTRDHVRALAEVVETHWRRLNNIQQKAVHSGTVESQRLFAYTLLFVADLLEISGAT